MENITAILSMLHEPPSGGSAGSATAVAGVNSATRSFRDEPVLSWTLRRLGMSDQIGTIAVICWEDQLAEVAPIASEHDAHILAKGPRICVPTLEAVAAARRWADGWRGGLLGTCDFDLGFHGPWIEEVLDKLASDAVLLVDPSAGLVDARILDRLIEHARRHPNVELCFTQAAPGLAGALLQPPLLKRLASTHLHPGRLLHYLPDQPMRDPIGGDACAPVPASVARTTRSFRLDSDRQVRRMTEAAVNLNGQLASSDAEDLLNRLDWTRQLDDLPRDLVLEVNTARHTSPIFWIGRHHAIQRAPLTPELAERLFSQIGSAADDVRLTLAGAGDPLLHPEIFQIIDLAQRSGIGAVHVETDLLPAVPDTIDRLVHAAVDAVSVHLPAMAPATYQAVMGVDRFGEVVENIRRFVTRRHELGRGVPILVPVFTKCAQNLGEMEVWYDQWLKALAAASIVGPSDGCGQIPDCAVAGMSPPRRRACSRLWSRLMVLCDGTAVACEQDALAREPVGNIATDPLADLWQSRLAPIRAAHRSGRWDSLPPLCCRCSQWHRP